MILADKMIEKRKQTGLSRKEPAGNDRKHPGPKEESRVETKNQKQLARAAAKARRADLTKDNIAFLSKRITAHALQLPSFAKAQSVFCFVSFGDEVDTTGILQACIAMNKTLYVPFIQSKVMLLSPVRGMDDLIPGEYGILTSKNPPLPALPHVDISFIPGLAFDRRGYRIGYGGGYYDRYLSAQRDTFALGLLFSCQTIDFVPNEPFDRPCHALLDENGLTWVPAAPA